VEQQVAVERLVDSLKEFTIARNQTKKYLEHYISAMGYITKEEPRE